MATDLVGNTKLQRFIELLAMLNHQTVDAIKSGRTAVLEKIADKRIPVHIVTKKIERLCEDGVTRKPEKENGKKFETLVVDLIKPMESVLPFEVVREKEFAPIKNKTGVDSVESARELLKLNGVVL